MKSKDQLKEYLILPLKPFCRGTADCCAWVAGWVNTLTGEQTIELKEITFGEAKRMLTKTSLVDWVEKYLKPLKFKKMKTPKDGDIVAFECPHALMGQAVRIYSDGSAVTRMEGDKLYVTKEPKILSVWRFQA